MIILEDDTGRARRMFLCCAALTTATVEFGGMTSHTFDHIDAVIHSYDQHLREMTNKNQTLEAAEIFAVAGEAF